MSQIRLVSATSLPERLLACLCACYALPATSLSPVALTPVLSSMPALAAQPLYEYQYSVPLGFPLAVSDAAPRRQSEIPPQCGCAFGALLSLRAASAFGRPDHAIVFR